MQHQDGHSHISASTVPNLKSYDPAFGYELALIIRDGIRRMYTNGENIFYYLTVYNENQMPALPAIDDIEERVVKGVAPTNKAMINLLAVRSCSRHWPHKPLRSHGVCRPYLEYYQLC